MTINLDGLERLARAATPGPWDAGESTIGGPNHAHGLWEWFSNDFEARGNPTDAAYIAAANPSTMLALIAEVRLLRKIEDLLGRDAPLYVISEAMDKYNAWRNNNPGQVAKP